MFPRSGSDGEKRLGLVSDDGCWVVSEGESYRGRSEVWCADEADLRAGSMGDAGYRMDATMKGDYKESIEIRPRTELKRFRGAGGGGGQGGEESRNRVA